MEPVLGLLPEDQIRPLRRSEYDRLAELGAFEGESVELLHGRIVRLAPQGPEHAASTTVLARLLTAALGDRAEVRVQRPFVASPVSEPEPDLAVVPAGSPFHHPDQAHLVVEVAFCSQDRDRAKGALYAVAGVPEYWLVDLTGRRVERYRTPLEGRYAESSVHGPGDTLGLLAFPDVQIELAQVLPR